LRGKHCQQIAAHDVSHLVRKANASPLAGPILGILGENDHWPENAITEGEPGLRSEQDADGALKPEEALCAVQLIAQRRRGSRAGGPGQAPKPSVGEANAQDFEGGSGDPD